MQAQPRFGPFDGIAYNHARPFRDEILDVDVKIREGGKEPAVEQARPRYSSGQS